MTVTEQPPADTSTRETTPDVRPDTSPSVRTVAVAFGAIVATAVGIVAFVAGGWIALAGAGAVATAGGIATARARNPRPRKTRPGLLTTLIGRPRKPGKSSGSLPWSLTGSQSARAAKRAGIQSRQTGRGKGTGTGLKLPAVTNKGRAKKASTAGTGRALTAKKATAARPVAKASGKPGTAPRADAAKKTTGPGRSRPSTPTKTPAKPATRPRLVTPSPKTTGRVAKKAAARPRAGATPAKRPGARPGTGRVSNGGKGATILPFKRTAKKTAGGSATRRTSPGVTSPRKRSTGMSQRRRGVTAPLKRTTAAKRLGRKATGGPTTKRARRLGTPKMRRVLRGPAAKVPNRTPRRPTTGTGAPSTRRLIGTALRVPRRNNKLSLARPTKAAQRKARRALKLRGKLAGRRMLGRLRRSPGWLFQHRPLWLWPAFVPPIPAACAVPNATDPVVEPTPVPDRERGPRRARTPYPQLTGRRAGTNPKEHATVSNPLETITEALGQLTSFDPENALEIERFVAGLGHVFTEFSGNLAGVSDRWSSEQPLAAEVLESIHQVASVCAGVADIADEAHSTFQSAHEAELTRLREPRANEQAWDVTQNQ